jgi:hypothetical protein
MRAPNKPRRRKATKDSRTLVGLLARNTAKGDRKAPAINLRSKLYPIVHRSPN